jgi:hypothetical protein
LLPAGVGSLSSSAAKGDQEIAGRLKFEEMGIRVVRFPGEQCDTISD